MMLVPLALALYLFSLLSAATAEAQVIRRPRGSAVVGRGTAERAVLRCWASPRSPQDDDRTYATRGELPFLIGTEVTLRGRPSGWSR